MGLCTTGLIASTTYWNNNKKKSSKSTCCMIKLGLIILSLISVWGPPLISTRTGYNLLSNYTTELIKSILKFYGNWTALGFENASSPGNE